MARSCASISCTIRRQSLSGICTSTQGMSCVTETVTGFTCGYTPCPGKPGHEYCLNTSRLFRTEALFNSANSPSLCVVYGQDLWCLITHTTARTTVFLCGGRITVFSHTILRDTFQCLVARITCWIRGGTSCYQAHEADHAEFCNILHNIFPVPRLVE